MDGPAVTIDTDTTEAVGRVETIGPGDHVVVLFNDEEGGCVIRVDGEQKIGRTR
jgi:Zn-dependent alcohol dehydrogenase